MTIDCRFMILIIVFSSKILGVHLLTSSGQMINLKLSRSSGSGNSVPQVFGRLSSFISKKITLDERERKRERDK